MAIFWALCMLPLSLVEKLSALQCSSLFGVLSLFYLVASVVAHALISRLRGHSAASLAELATEIGGAEDGVRLVTVSTQSIESLAIIAFAFTMQACA